ncbi:hypothetical protein KZ810_01320 [Sphingomonas sp. RHCKR47]|uniref:hypothetical protein n=1 Tax=Sphingomonas citricola TaxID=2862498 RepID=UPI001CA518D4|nr:hypothetical protein [Sphingomonas citricola]MBW6522127.1 hypothetical protein [Sphingomonas citricola]
MDYPTSGNIVVWKAGMMKGNLFGDVFGEIGGLPCRAWIVMCLFGIVMAGADVLGWSSGPGLSSIDYVSASITAPLGLFAAYFAGMSMVSRRVSGLSFLRFIFGVFSLFSFLIIGIGSILVLLPSPYKGIILTVALTLIFFGWLALAFLPSWPIAQALSSKLVSPTRLFHGTKGHRGSLFLIFFVGGSFNNLVPSTAAAKSLGEAMVYAVGNSAVSVFTITLFVALSVTAWRYASANDKTLYGDEPRAAGVF